MSLRSYGNLMDSRLAILPGKEAISAINRYLQENYAVNITSTSIIDMLEAEEMPG